MEFVTGKAKHKTRARRKQEYISIKNAINDPRNIGNFHTHHLLDEDDKLKSVGAMWADIYFIDPKTKIVYNTTVQVGAVQLVDDLSDLADKTLIEDGTFDKDYENYCTLTRDKKVLELAKNPENLVVGIDAHIQLDYRFGVGLTLVIDAEYLTIENINLAIEEFLSGEYESYRTVSCTDDHQVFDSIRRYMNYVEENNAMD